MGDGDRHHQSTNTRIHEYSESHNKSLFEFQAVPWHMDENKNGQSTKIVFYC